MGKGHILAARSLLGSSASPGLGGGGHLLCSLEQRHPPLQNTPFPQSQRRDWRWMRVAARAIKEIRQINMSLKSPNGSAGIPKSAVILSKLCSWQTFIQWLFNSSWLTARLWWNRSHSLPPVLPSAWREFPLLWTAREKRYNCSFWKLHLNQGSRINITAPRIC